MSCEKSIMFISSPFKVLRTMSKVEAGESKLSESNTSLPSNSSQLFEDVDIVSRMEIDVSPIAFKASQKLDNSDSRSSYENTSQELALEFFSPSPSGIYSRKLDKSDSGSSYENTSQELALEFFSPSPSGIHSRKLRSRSISLSPPEENPVRKPRRSIIPDTYQRNSKRKKIARLNIKELGEMFEPISEIEEENILNQSNMSAHSNENCNNDTFFNQCAGTSNLNNSTQSTNAVEDVPSTKNNEVSLIVVERDKVQANGSNSTEEHAYLQNNEDNLSDLAINGSVISQNIELNLTGTDQAEANYSGQMLARVSVISIANQQLSDGINSKKSLVLQIFRSSKGGAKLNPPLKVVIPCAEHNVESISISFSNTEVSDTNIDQSTQTETQVRQISNQSENKVELLKPSTSRDGIKKPTFKKTKNLKLLKKSKYNNKNQTNKRNVSKKKAKPSLKTNIPKKTKNVNQQKKPESKIPQNKNQKKKQIETKKSSTAKQRLSHSHAHSRCHHSNSGSRAESGSATEDSDNYSDSDTSLSSYCQHCDCSDCVDNSSSPCHCQSSSSSSSSTDWSDYEQSNSRCHNDSKH